MGGSSPPSRKFRKLLVIFNIVINLISLLTETSSRMPILGSCQPSPLFEYLDQSVSVLLIKKHKNILTLQGGLVDFSVLAGHGTQGVQCHKTILAALSPFLLSLLEETNGDQLILADFSISEIRCLMNLAYTGM